MQTRRLRAFAALAASGWVSGCDEPGTQLELSFPDELSAAPVRTVQVVLDAARTCDEALRLRFDQLIEGASAPREVSFPIRDDAEPLADLGPGETSVVVGARDADGLVVARGCQRVSGSPQEVRVAMDLWPRCNERPSVLDVAIVLDASAAMERANIALEESVQSGLIEEIVRAPDGRRVVAVVASSTSVVVTGPDPDDAADAIAGADLSGTTRAIDGIVSATRWLRNDARCGVAPVVLAVVAGADAASTSDPVDARLGLSGAESDPDDDVFIYGLALDDGGLETLRLSSPMSNAQRVGPLRSTAVYRFQLAEANRAFASRLDR